MSDLIHEVYDDYGYIPTTTQARRRANLRDRAHAQEDACSNTKRGVRTTNTIHLPSLRRSPENRYKCKLLLRRKHSLY